MSRINLIVNGVSMHYVTESVIRGPKATQSYRKNILPCANERSIYVVAVKMIYMLVLYYCLAVPFHPLPTPHLLPYFVIRKQYSLRRNYVL